MNKFINFKNFKIMENCLVTKLKSAVNNPRLVTLDEILVPFYSPGVVNLVAAPGTLTIYDSSFNVVKTATDRLLAENLNYDGYVKVNIKNASAVGLGNCDLSDVKFVNFAPAPIRTQISIRSSRMNDTIDNLVKYIPNSQEYNFENCNMSGNLDSFLTSNDTLVCTRMNYLNVSNNTNIVGKRSTINKLITLLNHTEQNPRFVYDGITIIEDV